MWNTTKTIPTVGRKVWFWPHEGILDFADVAIKDETQPFDATVVFVNHERATVNLLIVDHSGDTHNSWDVPLFDPLPPDEIQSHLDNLVDMEAADNRWGIATWMPYQAQKHSEEAGKTPLQGVRPVNLTLTDGKDV